MSTVGIYAGSFDPVTNGHLWMIDESARLFDQLIVAIGDNPSKRCMFTREERLDHIHQAIGSDPLLARRNIKVEVFANKFLVRFAKECGATHLVRGLRDATDFAFEQGLQNINRDLEPSVSTVFLTPPRELREVSSSLVKGLVGPEGWEQVVGHYAPSAVCKALYAKHHA
jgi:pantetheine-phosphate adenylyltransferase